MQSNPFDLKVARRTLLKAGIALSAVQVASPFIIKARAKSRSNSASTTPSPALMPNSAAMNRSAASWRSSILMQRRHSRPQCEFISGRLEQCGYRHRS